MTGHGEVEVVPDALRLELRVETEAIGVADALAFTRTTMVEVRRGVTECGVANADQQTSGLSVWQRHDDRTGAPKGFQAGESLSVLLRDPASVDAVLAAAAAAAGDRLRVGGLGMAVTDPAAALDDARRQALVDAERIAGVYAAAAGRMLGGLVALTEGRGSRSHRSGGDMVELAARGYGAGGYGGVEPGTQTVGVDVVAEWSLV